MQHKRRAARRDPRRRIHRVAQKSPGRSNFKRIVASVLINTQLLAITVYRIGFCALLKDTANAECDCSDEIYYAGSYNNSRGHIVDRAYDACGNAGRARAAIYHGASRKRAERNGRRLPACAKERDDTDRLRTRRAYRSTDMRYVCRGAFLQYPGNRFCHAQVCQRAQPF